MLRLLYRSAKLGDGLTFKENILRQTRDLDAGAGRVRLSKILGIDGVDGGKIVHVFDEDSSLDDFGNVASGGFQERRNVLNADKILVLEHGQIIEQGNPETLLAQRGKYYQLYNGMFELS